MASIGKECKNLIVQEIHKRIDCSNGFIVVSFSNIPNSELESLRKKLFELNSKMMIVKKSLCRVVFKDIGIEQAGEFLSESSALVFSNNGDSAILAKTIQEFNKKNQTFKATGAYLEESVLGEKSVNEIASLPPKNVLYAQVVAGLNAPIAGFVCVLNGLISGFVRVLDQIKESKEK